MSQQEKQGEQRPQRKQRPQGQTPTPVPLCVVNAKGGVGKTTVAINVACALNHLGKDVILIDLDPQGNATEGLGFLDAYNAEPPSLFNLLLDKSQRDRFDEVIVEHEEIDLLPSNIDMLAAERDLTIADLMARLEHGNYDVDPEVLTPLARLVTPDSLGNATFEHAKWLLSDLLSHFEHEYDFIIVDSPPFHGELLDNGLFAAPDIIVPALAETTSQGAIELLFDEVAALERETGQTIHDVAAFANRVEASTNEAEKMLKWLNAAFEDVPTYEVRKRVALQYAFDEGVSIFEYDRESDVADVFLEAAHDLVERYTWEDDDV